MSAKDQSVIDASRAVVGSYSTDSSATPSPKEARPFLKELAAALDEYDSTGTSETLLGAAMKMVSNIEPDDPGQAVACRGLSEAIRIYMTTGPLPEPTRTAEATMASECEHDFLQAVFDAAQNIADTSDLVDFLPGDNIGFMIGRQQHRALKSALEAHAKAHPPELRKQAGWEMVQFAYRRGDTVRMEPSDPTRAGAGAIGTVCALTLWNNGNQMFHVQWGKEPFLSAAEFSASELFLVKPASEPPPPPNETTTKGAKPDKAEDALNAVLPLSSTLIGRVFNAARVAVNHYCGDGKYLKEVDVRILEDALDACKGTYMQAGTRIPPVDRDPIVGIDPGAPNPQPMILQLEKGDVCVLTMDRDSREQQGVAYLRWKAMFPGIQIEIQEYPVQVLRPAKGSAVI